MKYSAKIILSFVMMFFYGASFAAESDYKIGAGDVVKISVYSNPDMLVETKVSESGNIRYPLIGEVKISGETVSSAEQKIAAMLKKGGFINEPHVNVYVSQYLSKVVSVLGGVNKPNRYGLEKLITISEAIALAGGVNGSGSDLITVSNKDGKKDYDLKAILSGAEGADVRVAPDDVIYVHSNDVSVIGQVNRPGKYAVTSHVRTLGDFLAMAGGVNSVGSDTIIVTSVKNNAVEQKEINVQDLYQQGGQDINMVLSTGDTIYVPRAPMVYIYGEVQKPGSVRLEKNMTVMQALAQGGGPTIRGTQRGLKVHRQTTDGGVEMISPKLTDFVMANDVLYVEESVF